MKISEVIDKLQKIKDANGDINIVAANSAYVWDLDDKAFDSIFQIDPVDDTYELTICTE